MNILIITPVYVPAYIFGGTVTAISQLAKALNENSGINVTVYTTNASGKENKLDVELESITLVDKVPTIYFDCGRWNKSAYYSAQLIQYLENDINQFDIVYISSIWQWLGYKSAKICIKNNIPFILGTHGSFSENLRKKSKLKKNIYYNIFLKNILRKASAIHVTGRQEVIDAGDWLNDYNTMIKPNIIDSKNYYIMDKDEIKQKIFTKYNIPKHAKLILTVSRPDWTKRVDLLLKAIRETEDLYLIYVGNTDSLIVDEWIEMSVDLNVEKRFMCIGELYGEDLLEIYNIADVFSLVSVNENFGMVVVESMLCGTPTLISREVGVSEHLLNNTYSQITNLDVSSIKENLHTILEKHYDKDDIRRSVLEIFSGKVLSKKYINEFQKILEGAK